MSDTEIRMMRYTIEQLSADLQATRQYVSDIKSKYKRTRKALDVAVDALKVYANQENWDFEHFYLQRTYEIAGDALEQITALEKSELENLEMLVNNVFK